METKYPALRAGSPASGSNSWIRRVTWFGVPFFWIFTLSLMWSSLRVTIPAIEDKTTQQYLSYLVYIIFIESVWNWVLIARVNKLKTKSNYPTNAQQEPGGIGEGWKYCEKCQTVAPPRSHHCVICNTCVLRRDHHCYFTGTCVEHSNQRRFIVLMVYLTAGSVLGFVLNVMYVQKAMPITTDFMYYMPMLALYRYFFIGGITLTSIFVLVQGYFCLVTFAGAIGYLAVEIVLTVKGQTQFESSRNIVKYKQNVFQNVRTVFGTPWLLPVHFILPLAIPLPSDGSQWEHTKSHGE